MEIAHIPDVMARTYFYKEGVETIAWEVGASSNAGSQAKNADHLYLYAYYSPTPGIRTYVTTNPIDVTDLTYICFDFETTDADTHVFDYGVSTVKADSSFNAVSGRINMVGTARRGTRSVDVTSLSGNYYLKLQVYTASGSYPTSTAKIYNVYASHFAVSTNYRFNSGALTTDSFGNGYTLSNNNGVSEAIGRFGAGGADFGSNNSNKSLSDSRDMGANWAISFWIKQDAERTSGQYQKLGGLIMSNNVYPEHSFLYHNNGGTFRVGIGRHHSNVYLDHGWTNLSQGLGTGWHHVVINRVASDTTVFIDKAQVATRNYASSGGSGTSYRYFGQGFGDGGGGSYWSGLMSDLTTFSKGLSQAEINAIFKDQSFFFLV